MYLLIARERNGELHCENKTITSPIMILIPLGEKNGRKKNQS
jgi:hypothetical protein